MKKFLLISILLLSNYSNSQDYNAYPNNVQYEVNGFIKNEGQIMDQDGHYNKDVFYLLNTKGLNVQLRKQGFSYDIYERKTEVKKETERIRKPTFNSEKNSTNYDTTASDKLFHRVDIDFLEVSDRLVIKEQEPVKSYMNYYNSSGKEESITHVKSFKKIVYENLYPGINVEFFVPEDFSKPVEYNFIVKPEGNIANIKMKVSGADVALQDNILKMRLIHGNLNEIIPKSWIQNNHSEDEVQINYVEKSKNTFGFQSFTSQLNSNETLIIDPTPVRLWATYFGGDDRESPYIGAVKSDSNGNVIIGGFTDSASNIATSGGFQTSWRSNVNAFLAKFDAAGTMLWGTYYGGGDTYFYDITVDASDQIIAVGDSYSESHIATPDAHQATKNPSGFQDGIVVKFDSDGRRLWGSYYGGDSIDQLLSVKTDQHLNIYFAGTTASRNNIAIAGAFKDTSDNIDVHSNWDAFIVKMDKDGNRQWATYYGEEGHEDIKALEIDSFGNLYGVGSTTSSEGIATAGAHQENFNRGVLLWDDAFLVKFDPNGNRLWGTYFGGTDYDFGRDIAIDSKNNVIISGQTRSNQHVATADAHQQYKGGAPNDFDAYLAKFNQNGSLLWSTFYGGSKGDGSSSVATDANDNIFLLGETNSSNNISTPDAFQEYLAADSDLFLIKFDPLGSREWGTYYGGNSSEFTLGLDITQYGEIYMLGLTYSTVGIASHGAHQNYNAGKGDWFLVKFKDCLSSITADATEFICTGEAIALKASGGITYLWSGPNGFGSTDQNPIIPNAGINHSGTYSVYIESGDGCDDTRTFEIVVSERPVAYVINDLDHCEDVVFSGISSHVDTTSIESQILGGQTGKVLTYYDGMGNPLPSPLPNPMTNTQTHSEIITVRIANVGNPECFAETSFRININQLPYLDVIAPIYACDDDNDGIATFDVSTLEAMLIAGQTGMELEFFHENGQQLSTPLPASINNLVANKETIKVIMTNTITNCKTESRFDLIANPAPITHSVNILYGCDDNNDGISEYFDTSTIESQVLNGQTGMNITYYTANGIQLSSPLPNPYTNTITNNETIVIRVTSPVSSCYAETILELKTVAQPYINRPDDLFACDQGNGYSNFDTSLIEHQIIGNRAGLTIHYFDSNNNELPSPLPAVFKNTQPFFQTIYVRVEDISNPICYSETSFELIVNRLPEINLEKEYFICDLEPSINLALDPNFDTYSWRFENGNVISTTAQANIINDGTYTVQVSKEKNNIICYNSFSFRLVRSRLPAILNVNYGELGNNYIEIIAGGDGDFEYSIDDINYQSSNYFTNIAGGIYTAYVRDRNGCGKATEEINIIDYPKFFTPNNDSYNDHWQIKGLSKYPNAKIIIFDRYGKIIAKLSSNDLGWDGFYNGKAMPSTDYWFSAKLSETIIFSGHFSLKR